MGAAMNSVLEGYYIKPSKSPMAMWTIPMLTGAVLDNEFYVNIGGKNGAINGSLEEQLFFVLMIRARWPR